MEQLQTWLAKARADLADVDAAIAALERQVAAQEAIVARLERITLDSTPVDANLMAQLYTAKTRLGELNARLAKAHERRNELIAYIDWILVQIAAVEEMEEHGGG